MRTIFLLCFLALAPMAPGAALRAQRLSDPSGVIRTPSNAMLTVARQPSTASRASVQNIWGGVIIGAVAGAAIGAAWAKHVDRQQVCPAAGPCEGGSNVRSYAIRGAALGAVLGGSIGWLARRQ